MLKSNEHNWSSAGKVFYVQFNNPASLPPLEHSTRILAENGWQVLALGSRQNSADSLRFPAHPKIDVRMLPYCPPGWRQKLHFLRFCFWIWGGAFRWQPQWIYVSDMMACPAALPLIWFSRWKVLYHEHDSPNQSPEGGVRPSAFIRLVLWSRRQVARRAAFCVVPNAGRAKALKDTTGTNRPIIEVWNCPRREEVEDNNAGISAGETATPEARRQFVLYYHGSIVPARLPLAVLQAMAAFPGKIRLRVAGYETNGHPGYVAKLQAEARRLGLGDSFEYLGSISRSGGLLAACRQSDVGLTLLPADTSDINERTMPGASNKPFDYLACGLPLLVSARPEWEEMFVRPGYAIACQPADANSIIAALRKFMENPEARRQMGERGRKRIVEEWNYETQFAPVLARMQGEGERR